MQIVLLELIYIPWQFFNDSNPHLNVETKYECSPCEKGFGGIRSWDRLIQRLKLSEHLARSATVTEYINIVLWARLQMLT